MRLKEEFMHTTRFVSTRGSPGYIAVQYPAGGVHMNVIIMVRFCWATLVALFGFAVSASVSEAAATLEANKRLVLRYYDAALNGRYEEIDQIFADNYVRHNQSEWVSKAPPQSEIARAIHRHMPDQRATFEVILAEDDLVAVRWRLQGNPGDLPIKILRMAIGPRGPVTHTGINIFRIRDGRIVENWNDRDDLALWTQLGLFRWYGIGGFIAGALVAVLIGQLIRHRAVRVAKA
jgi:predicted SnoaL-like aldol condensation-catalyzing enzyme